MNRLEELRKEKGFSMREAAAKLELAYTTYRSYEKEERDMNSELIRKFAGFYGVSTDYLLCRSDDREKEEVHDEVMELRQMMRERPELPFLMNLAKNAKASDVLQASALLQKLMEESENK